MNNGMACTHFNMYFQKGTLNNAVKLEDELLNLQVISFILPKNHVSHQCACNNECMHVI